VSARADAPYHLLEVYAHGRTARDVIAEGHTPAKQVAKWAAALANALAYMESRNLPIYHGDISPRNIIFDEDQPHLVDFGLAYLGTVGQESGVVGTAPYRPPERDLPRAPWPPSGDVYSLGLVLSELLFGELPYRCDGGQWNKQHLRDDLFEPHGKASREFLQILRRAVAPTPAERFANAAEFQRALAGVSELSGTVETPRQERGINRYVEASTVM
jgi:serine/threonine protein kinase